MSGDASVQLHSSMSEMIQRGQAGPGDASNPCFTLSAATDSSGTWIQPPGKHQESRSKGTRTVGGDCDPGEVTVL